MNDLVYILSNPEEYRPVLIIFGILAITAAVLTIFSLIAWIGAARGRVRSAGWLIAAVCAASFSLIGLAGRFEFYGPEFRSLNLNVVFLIPAALGCIAIWTWWRRNRRASV